MKTKINKYFQDKGIKALVLDYIDNDNEKIYRIKLNDITKISRFNKTMTKELSYILGCQVLIDVQKDIKIIIPKEKIANTSDDLKILIGHDEKKKPLYVSMIDEPHLLISGCTGSGKSVFLNNLINELIDKYNDNVEFCFIDLKRVELARYKNLNTNISGIIEDIDGSINLLDSCIELMNKRYTIYEREEVLNIQDYNKIHVEEPQRHLFIVIDELAELMLQNKKAIQTRLQRLLQLGRAAGIHVIGATQRPSVDVLAGTLKVNFTTRICFKVKSIHDSKTAIGFTGAELLQGNGDGLLLRNTDTTMTHFQGLAPCNSEVLEQNLKEINDNSIHLFDFIIGKINWSMIGNIVKIIFKICYIGVLIVWCIIIWVINLFVFICKKRR